MQNHSKLQSLSTFTPNTIAKNIHTKLILTTYFRSFIFEAFRFKPKNSFMPDLPNCNNFTQPLSATF